MGGEKSGVGDASEVVVGFDGGQQMGEAAPCGQCGGLVEAGLQDALRLVDRQRSGHGAFGVGADEVDTAGGFDGDDEHDVASCIAGLVNLAPVGERRRGPARHVEDLMGAFSDMEGFEVVPEWQIERRDGRQAPRGRQVHAWSYAHVVSSPSRPGSPSLVTVGRSRDMSQAFPTGCQQPWWSLGGELEAEAVDGAGVVGSDPVLHGAESGSFAERLEQQEKEGG